MTNNQCVSWPTLIVPGFGLCLGGGMWGPVLVCPPVLPQGNILRGTTHTNCHEAGSTPPTQHCCWIQRGGHSLQVGQLILLPWGKQHASHPVLLLDTGKGHSQPMGVLLAGCILYIWKITTMQCCYNMVNFLRSPHNLPLDLWVQSMTFVIAVLCHVIMAPTCT